MAERGDHIFLGILMFFAVIAIAGVLLHNLQIEMECGDKRCEHGRPMTVRDQSESIGFNKCICAEEPK